MTYMRVSDGERQRLLPRQRIGLGLHATSVAALVVIFLTVAPASHWDHLGLLAVIGVLAVIADRSRISLPTGIHFDATIALVLLAVVTSGAPAALIVFVLPWLVDAATGGRSLLRASALGDLSLYGWQAVAAAFIVVAAPDGAAALPYLIAAGAAQYVVGWAAGPAIYATLWVGTPFRSLVRALIDMAPAATVMIVLGALTVVLSAAIGVAALALFAAIAVLPQSALTYAARTRPVGQLDRGTATRRYVYALALHLGLSHAERRHLLAVASAARRRPPTGDAVDYVLATLGDHTAENLEAQVVTEWFNGCGGPIGLRGEAIPVAARVLAVAQTWSELTARGTPQLGHREALAHLQAAAGARLDPGVVRAAHAVVAQERVSAAEPAPEPRMHLLRVPAPLRRALAAA